MRHFRSLRIIAWLVLLAALITVPSLFGCACGSRGAPLAVAGPRLIPACAAPLPGSSPYPGTPGTTTPGAASPATTATP